MFTQKHYEFFARFLGRELKHTDPYPHSHTGDTNERDRANDNYAITDLVDSLIEEFEKDSPKFKAKLFKKRIQEVRDATELG